MALAERPRTTQATQQHTTERAALTSMQGSAGELLTAYLAVQVGETLHVCTLEWHSSDPPDQIDVGLEPEPGGHVAYVRVLRSVARLLWRQEQAARQRSNVWAARRWQAGACRLVRYLVDYEAAAREECASVVGVGDVVPECDDEAVACG